MSQRGKLLETIRRSPNSVTFTQLRKLLEQEGFFVERVAGSHHVFRKNATIFVVPVHRNHVKTVYVKRVIDILEQHGKS